MFFVFKFTSVVLCFYISQCMSKYLIFKCDFLGGCFGLVGPYVSPIGILLSYIPCHTEVTLVSLCYVSLLIVCLFIMILRYLFSKVLILVSHQKLHSRAVLSITSLKSLFETKNITFLIFGANYIIHRRFTDQRLHRINVQ